MHVSTANRDGREERDTYPSRGNVARSRPTDAIKVNVDQAGKHIEEGIDTNGRPAAPVRPRMKDIEVTGNMQVQQQRYCQT